MEHLHEKLHKINVAKLETGQKIEMIVDEIFAFTKKETCQNINMIPNIETLKNLYSMGMRETKERMVISNINNWLKIDEQRLQGFRKKLDEIGISVRVICKPQGVKYEQSGFKNREIKTLSNKYLLISNIDIIDGHKIIITKPTDNNIGVYIKDQTIHSLLKKLFYDLRNGNQYILGITAGDALSTQKWIEIMHSGKNFGIDFVINPVLYPKIFECLKDGKKKIIDFGCGLNTLGMQLIYGIPGQIEGLKNIKNIEQLRKNIVEFTGFEANESFVEQALKDVKDIDAEELKIVWKELIKNNKIPKDDETIDMCISRNFIVHLNYDDFDYHLAEVQRILIKEGVYIVATLNPIYEQEKYKILTNKVLIDGDRYNHYHGENGELGTWVQYYKNKETLEKYMKKYFTIVDYEFCMPTNNNGIKSHPLYYNKNCPMGIIYTLKK